MNEKRPIVSVIIPFYNGDSRFLTEAVDSVLSQTFRDFELILVNDGSDASYDILIEKIKDKDNRIKVIKQSNQGVSCARNHGVREAQGEYVTFVDADDLVLPQFLETAVWAARKTGAEFVYGGAVYQKSRTDIPPVHDPVLRLLRGNQIQKFRKHLVSEPIKIETGGYHPRGSIGRLIKTTTVKQVPFHEDISIGEDVIWNLEMSRVYQSVCLVGQIWYIYYDNSSSVTHRYDPNMFSKCDSEIKMIEGLMDLKDDGEYRSFVNYVFEELQRVIICSYRWKQWRNEKSQGKAFLDKIYHSAPWKEMTNVRYGKLVKGKRLLRYLLHKCRMYIFLYSMAK